MRPLSRLVGGLQVLVRVGIVGDPGTPKQGAPSLGVPPPMSIAMLWVCKYFNRMLVSVQMLVRRLAELRNRVLQLLRLPTTTRLTTNFLAHLLALNRFLTMMSWLKPVLMVLRGNACSTVRCPSMPQTHAPFLHRDNVGPGATDMARHPAARVQVTMMQ